MCAIFGIVGKYDLESAEKAFALLKHRGMDGSRSISLPLLFLGSHRLAIRSFGEEMHQPLEKEGVYLVFNGEIYNHLSLAENLGLDSVDEAALLLACYKEYGDDFVTRLRGMYAIAIIDSGRVKLYRDPAGKKPLYYCHTSEGFSFSSEIRALLKGRKTRFDTKQIPVYLSFQSTITPNTFFEEIQQLKAGESLLYNGDEITTRSFHDLLESTHVITGRAEALSLIRETLEEAVSLRIPSKVPYATLLSGGLDSSLIAALAIQKAPLRSYCIGYEGYDKYDERPYARETASHIGSDHHEVLFGKEEFFRAIESVTELLDEPLADPAVLPLYHLMGYIANDGVKVILTGDGSDELFMGYKNYAEFSDLEQLGMLKRKNWLKNYMKSHYSMHREWEWHKRILEGSLLFRGSSELFTDLQQNRLLKSNIRDNHSLEAIRSYREAFEASGRRAPVDWYSYIDMKVQLGEVYLKKLDRVSMANGIEARTPFLDRELVATAFAIDAELRMGSKQKHLLKTVASEYLPPSIVDRKKKGFNYPFMEWLREGHVLSVIDEVQEEMGLFRDEQLQYLLKEGEHGRFKHQLFSLFMLCKWIVKREGMV